MLVKEADPGLGALGGLGSVAAGPITVKSLTFITVAFRV
jgi:hypothetical protein